MKIHLMSYWSSRQTFCRRDACLVGATYIAEDATCQSCLRLFKKAPAHTKATVPRIALTRNRP